MVVFDAGGGEGLAFAVFEPFLCGLVAADVELPCGSGDFADAGGFVPVHAAGFGGVGVGGVAGLVHLHIGFGAVEGGDETGDVGLWVLQGVPLAQFAADGGKAQELAAVFGVGDAGEAAFEEFGVAAAVGGAVQDGVDVVEQGFGGKAVGLCRIGICCVCFGFTGFSHGNFFRLQAALRQGLRLGIGRGAVGEAGLVAEGVQLGGVDIGMAVETVVQAALVGVEI